ncbi:uncharacterized protein At2g33490 [Diospyros lotus]|uniref:uncharacterized protein At2g33490 n=1 Tax=Diospyros lotus TaxID=55363 RepID=UPI00225AED11|nr:uncharacterized protein At2g33490 [Diospyros lotus]XP_052185730.1 uncharacterized protein At2g33490 [Diospyros lotus]
MRNSLKKLRGFALPRHGERGAGRDRRLQQSLAQLDELARASQDMQDMRDCYDSLLSAAAATLNSAYEFSESLSEMGACLLEKTALYDDDESGKVLLMLGKLQFELQKLLDKYRAHIIKTITVPSESLLNELQIVEEMKRQCDEKRSVYDDMIMRQKEKGKLRGSKGESFHSKELLAAHEDFEAEATLFVFRLKSLKQGQSRSLLTQAARHHAAQLCFFRKAVKSLEIVEPHVKLVTEQQRIDYHFAGLKDGDSDDSNDEDDSDDYDEDGDYNVRNDGELSFDYGQNDKVPNVVSALRSSMEEKLDKNRGRDSVTSDRKLRASSQSEPLFADQKFDRPEKFRQLKPLSSRKFTSYVLPTPVQTKNSIFAGPDSQVSGTKRPTLSGDAFSYRHSSPLELNKYEKMLRNEKLSGPIILGHLSGLKENNNNISSTSLPPPLAEELKSRRHDKNAASDTKKIKRHAFSGPLTGKSWSNKPGLSAGSPIVSTGPHLFSGPLLHTPMRQSSPPKLSPSSSPTFVSSPKISELHELPRPPANLASKPSAKLPPQIGYSAPLVSKSQDNYAANKMTSNAASPLPMPPSISSREQKETKSPVSEPFRIPQTLKMTEGIASPPLTPISLPNLQSPSTA